MSVIPLEEQRAAIERELAELRMRQPFPTEQGIAEHHAKIEELQERLQKLPPTPRDPIVRLRA